MAKVLDFILARLLIIKKNGGKGVKNIGKIVDQFQSLIEGLNKGVEQCEVVLKDNRELILTIQAENEKIGESIDQAKTFGENLKAMLDAAPAPVVESTEDTADDAEKTDSPEEE